jgi:hypothetical protein
MAEFSVYPDAKNGYAQLPLAVDSVTRVDAVTINRLRCAIINIERELGILPRGASDTVSTRLDNMMASAYKSPSRVATDNDITLLDGAPNEIDGITLATGDRVLVWAQLDQSENGIYMVSNLGTGSNGTWVRADDFISSVEAGAITYIQEGNVNKRTTFTLVTIGTIVIGTTNIEFMRKA